MKLLLVDDEEYVIESIKKNLNWEENHIVEVYTAFSVRQAKDIMGMVDIDIVISDIVMPVGTGFDFVEWVREQDLKVQVIFLTSYAEFDYARRAIQLHSVDYLLKPIDFEKLKEAVQCAEESVSREKKMQDLKKASIHWGQNRQVLQKDIWKSLLKSNLSEEKFCETAVRRQLSYEPAHLFRLICFAPEPKMHQQEKWDPMTMEFVIENVLSEMYRDTSIMVDTVFYEDPGAYWVVTQADGQESIQDDDKAVLKRFVNWMNEKTYPDLWCGVGNWENISQIRNQYHAICKMWEGSLTVWNKVLFLSEFQLPKTVYKNAELDIWKILLSEEKTEELMKRFRKYLSQMEHEGMITKNFLMSLRTDMSQIVYSWLSDMKIKAYALFSDKDTEDLHYRALYGRDEMMEYVEYLLHKAVQYKQYINKFDSVTNRVCAYIDAHYREEIHREELGELVFLSTDYLSRIFKREKGISISNYIIKKRVEEAKKLLTQSTLPINTVSLYAGYSNFSYFTKMFKENTGFAPLEYRRQFGN